MKKKKKKDTGGKAFRACTNRDKKVCLCVSENEEEEEGAKRCLSKETKDEVKQSLPDS